MQTVSGSSLSEVSGKFENDFFAKLKIEDDKTENEVKREKDEVEEDDDDDEEFTFVFADPNGSPISADDVFEKGQIRPIFPIFGQDLHFTDDSDNESGSRSPVKKIFVESPSSSGKATSSTSAAVEEGTYCEWNPKVAKKSNSTGSSKLWKLRDPKLRSNSDGKDAFVFLNPAKVEKASSGETKNVVVRKVKVASAKGKPAPSAHEKHYMMSKARKESDKRKSYLPYRQELFGFFSSTNGLGLSRNVHPY
ncbi:uncharacterized protein LOC131650757 [Vicia villosa]|uniref:uncharacterized protein LOC131650757 n=1 Tax=Vicia villosa TaxID=3911 RepID=UPI00273BE6EA|nr:uncharacterized protein LOC131650757 [Vicia villosa]